MMWLQDGKKFDDIFKNSNTQHAHDRRMEKQKDSQHGHEACTKLAYNSSHGNDINVQNKC